VLPDPALNPAHGLFSNPLDLPLSGGALMGVLVLLAAVSLCFAAGRWRRTAAVVLWFGWTALFHRNNLIANPSVPYVGLLLILTLLVPAGEPWSRGPRNADWAMPKWVFRAAWILMATGYTFSGITKLPSESWTDGSAMRFLLGNPLARPGWIREALLALPDVVLKLLTWATLAVELLFLPLALWSRSRPWIWLALVGMHLGVIAVVDFADLSLGMLMLHLFTFDPAWLKPRPSEPILVRFDGDCLMCSSTIRFVADEDRAKLVRFKPLEVEDGEEPDTMLVDAAGRTLDRSDGVLAILSVLGGHWRAMAMAGRLIPRPLRDALYRFIARNRYRWFGKGNACALPSEALRERLLD
jgi:predicted DCC family thiol-disulfide oxidoreductase YuxK